MCFLRRPQKFTKSSPSIWHLLHNVKSLVKIFSIFVAFLENINFTMGLGNPVLDIKSWNFKTSVFSRVSRAGFFVQFSPAVVSILHDLPLSRMLNSDMGMWHECQLWPHHDRSNAQRGKFTSCKKKVNSFLFWFSFIIPHIYLLLKEC